MTRLVLNADDFGLAPAHSRRIAALRESGLLTDTSLLANGISFEVAVAGLRRTGLSETGVHLCLTGGEVPVCAPRDIPSLLAGSVFRPHWFHVLAALAAGRIRRAEVEREWEAQIAPPPGRTIRPPSPTRRPARACAPPFSRASAAAACDSWKRPGFPSRRASSASRRRAT